MSDTSGTTQPHAGSSYALGETDTPPATAVEPKRRSRRAAHVASLLLCLVLTPVALVALDYALVEGWGGNVQAPVDNPAPDAALIAMAVVAGVLLVVAAASRLSGLGPLVAGLLWGVLPAVGFALVPATTTRRLLDIADPYDQFMTGLISVSPVFPVLAGLLVGVGLFGRWRASRPVAEGV